MAAKKKTEKKNGKKTAKKNSGPEIRCSYSSLRDVSSLQRHPRNPNKHPEDQVALLAKLIEHHGWRVPIVVSSLTGYITRGHGRLDAALLMKLGKVPVDVQEYDTEEDELADMLADNQIATYAELDMDLTTEVLKDLNGRGYEMDFTGFAKSELAGLLEAFKPDFMHKPDDLPPADYVGEDDSAGRIILVYANEDERAEWCDRVGISREATKVVFSLSDVQ